MRFTAGGEVSPQMRFMDVEIYREKRMKEEIDGRPVGWMVI